jgi:hypothetical protein
MLFNYLTFFANIYFLKRSISVTLGLDNDAYCFYLLILRVETFFRLKNIFFSFQTLVFGIGFIKKPSSSTFSSTSTLIVRKPEREESRGSNRQNFPPPPSPKKKFRLWENHNWWKAVWKNINPPALQTPRHSPQRHSA